MLCSKQKKKKKCSTTLYNPRDDCKILTGIRLFLAADLEIWKEFISLPSSDDEIEKNQ